MKKDLLICPQTVFDIPQHNKSILSIFPVLESQAKKCSAISIGNIQQPIVTSTIYADFLYIPHTLYNLFYIG